MSDNVLADYWLDCCDTSKGGGRLIQTACGSRSDFKAIAAELKKQHPVIHKHKNKNKHEDDKNRACRILTSKGHPFRAPPGRSENVMKQK